MQEHCDPRLIGVLSLSIKEAYRFLDELIDKEPVLKLPDMKKSWGHLRNGLVDVGIKQILSNSNIPHEIADKTTSKYRNGYTYLMIETKGAIITPAKVASAKEVPQEAIFRNKGSLLNKQYDLFTEPKNINNEYNETFPPFILLTYGGRDHKLEFINLGLPDVGVKQWVDLIEITNTPVIISNQDEITQGLQLTFTSTAEEILKRGTENEGEEGTI